MYILTADHKQIVNSEFVERFCINEKPDAALIVASYSDARPPVTIGRYLDSREAKETLALLIGALAGGQGVFDMPESLLYAQEQTKRDARTKRRGGS